MTLFPYFSKFLEVKLLLFPRFRHNKSPIRQQNDEIHWAEQSLGWNRRDAQSLKVCAKAIRPPAA
jgi:hypothetical protein